MENETKKQGISQRLCLALRFKIPRRTGDEKKGQDLPRRKRSQERRWTPRAPTPREYMTPSFLLLFLRQASRTRTTVPFGAPTSHWAKPEVPLRISTTLCYRDLAVSGFGGSFLYLETRACFPRHALI